MTNKSSSGDNKIHQIIMALITTIAAPVIVFFVTNNLKNSTSPTPTPLVQVITATSPAKTAVGSEAATKQPTATAVIQKTSTATRPPAAQPTQAGITNPSGTIPAGTAVQVDGLVLTISAQEVSSDGKNISVRVHVKNPGADRRTLIFTPGSITIKDDTGHSYAALNGDKKTGCSRDAANASHKVDIAPKGEVTLASVGADKTTGWCAENPGSAIPLFSGPLGKNAKKLEVQINGVGPFRGFQIEVVL